MLTIRPRESPEGTGYTTPYSVIVLFRLIFDLGLDFYLQQVIAANYVFLRLLTKGSPSRLRWPIIPLRWAFCWITSNSCSTGLHKLTHEP